MEDRRIVQTRARLAATWSYLFVAILWPILTWTTSAVHPDLFTMLTARPIALATTAVAMAGLVTVGLGVRRAQYLLAFIGSSAFLVGVLAATAASVFPVMLRATGGDSALAHRLQRRRARLVATSRARMVAGGIPDRHRVLRIPLQAASREGGGGDRKGRILTIRNAECGMRN